MIFFVVARVCVNGGGSVVLLLCMLGDGTVIVTDVLLTKISSVLLFRRNLHYYYYNVDSADYESGLKFVSSNSWQKKLITFKAFKGGF